MGINRFIASRYLRSRKESGVMSLVSVISITGIAVGTAVLIIALSTLDGFEAAITRKIIDFDSHIYISGFGKRDLEDKQVTVGHIKSITGDQLVSISPFLSRYSVLKNGKNYEGIELVAYTDEGIKQKTEKYIIEGKSDFITGDGYKKGIIIGEKLANTLNVKLGEKIILFSLADKNAPTINNPPVVDQFYVTGIFRSSMAKYDDLFAYINLDYASVMYESGDKLSGYNIKLNSIADLDSLRGTLQDRLGYPHYVRTVFKEHQNIFTWLELQKAPIPIILSLITIVAAFNMIGTLLMIIIEKTSDIGILRTLGASRYQVGNLVLTQGMYLSGIGLIIGNLLALGLSLLQNYGEIIKVPAEVYYMSAVELVIDPLNYLVVTAAGLLFCFVASYIPGRFASRISPVNAMRFK